MGREAVPRAPRRSAARRIGLKSGSAQALIWLENPGYSGQGVVSQQPDARVDASAVNGTRMTELPKKITDDPYGAAILIRRLVMEQGAVYWRRYLQAFALMAVSAAATAGSAWLLGQVINQAYVDKNIRGIAILSGITVVIFIIKGAATYGHQVILSQISNAILANNQRSLFAKLMNESVGFFSDRHSSEFLARLTAGATSVTQVLSLLINAVGGGPLAASRG